MKRCRIIFFALFVLPLFGRDTVVFGEPGNPNWRFIGKIPLVRPTAFTPVPNPERPGHKKMVVTASRSSGMMATVPGFDLRRTPIMRWRWRVVEPLTLPECADEKDDQALALYIGDGNNFRHRAISYRWEVNAPVGRFYRKYYSAGALVVDAVALRDRTVEAGKWVTQERNVVQDYRERFGEEIKSRFAVIVGANTQHLRRETVAEIDYIEFLSEEEAAADPIPADER
ncbi:MAG: DUF3047 domain-containing protein [Victivallaceae bacterium]|nr:DUF3047 domain-containing protein [Victivallaceae bacterium]